MEPVWYQNLILFAQIALAIVVEAAPFLLLGSILSALIMEFADPVKLARRLPQNPLACVGLGLVAGMALPTCECGVVPIVRRLLQKGVPASTALTYMLTAPVVNPVVLISTYVAFVGSLEVVVARALMVMVPAAMLGLLLGRIDPRVLLKAQPGANPAQPITSVEQLLEKPVEETCGCGHDHGSTSGSRLMRILSHSALEFLDMGKYLILGSLFAAGFKTFLPWDVLEGLEANPYLATGFMMLLAVLLSVCSEADAFVATSFSSFPLAAQLGFITLGPMLDLKLIGMFAGAFHRLVAIVLIVVPPLILYPLSLLVGALIDY
jgi:uncharacterized membrane protein YraQ (UPF0718 family)